MSGLPFVSVQPGMKFGEPCINGHRLPTQLIAETVMFNGGEEAMDWYDITRDEVMVACWFEARYGGRKIRKLWQAWLDEHEGTLWHSTSERWAAVPFPPLWLAKK